MRDYRYLRRRNGNSAFVIFLLISIFFIVWSIFQPAKAEDYVPDTRPIAFVIEQDRGGRMDRYEQRAKVMHGYKVIVDGPCLSACTMFLRKDYALDICVTPRAMFGFHKPYRTNQTDGQPFVMVSLEPELNMVWTDEFEAVMPEPIQKWLASKYVPSVTAGDPASMFLVYLGQDLPVCEEDWETRYQPRLSLDIVLE